MEEEKWPLHLAMLWPRPVLEYSLDFRDELGWWWGSGGAGEDFCQVTMPNLMSQAS